MSLPAYDHTFLELKTMIKMWYFSLLQYLLFTFQNEAIFTQQ